MSVTQIEGQQRPPMHELMRQRFERQSGEESGEATGRKRPGFAGHLAGSMVQEMDTDSDGSLCQCESGLSEDAFNAIDGDGDSILTRQEIASGLRDNRDAVATALGLERPEGTGPPPPGEGHPKARRAHMRQAMAAYEGSMSDLMNDVFVPTSEAAGETESAASEPSGETPASTTMESLDMAV